MSPDEMLGLASAVSLGLGLCSAIVGLGVAEGIGAFSDMARGLMGTALVLVLAGVEGTLTLAWTWWALPVLLGIPLVGGGLLYVLSSGLYRLGLWLGKDR